MSEDNKNSSKAGMIGLAIGFAAGALTVLLSDPDNRKKVKDTTGELLDTTVDTTRSTVEKVAGKVKDTADKVQTRVKASVDNAAKSVKAEIDEVEDKLNES